MQKCIYIFVFLLNIKYIGHTMTNIIVFFERKYYK